MRVESLEHQGTEAFPQPISVTLSALAEIVALCGKLGSGKTTFLDLIAAALYLVMPYRPGPLADIFTTNGYIRMAWTHRGEGLYSVVTVEPSKGRTEALLYDAGGKPLAGPLKGDYVRAIEERLGDLELFLATSYAVQPSVMSTRKPVSFMGVPRSERRSLMAGMLGLGRYEILKAFSDGKVQTAEKFVEAIQVKRGVYTRTAADLELVETQHRQAQDAIEVANGVVDDARRVVQDLQKRSMSQTSVAEDLAKLEMTLTEVKKRQTDLQIRKQTLSQPIVIEAVSDEDLVAADDAVKACERELAELDAEPMASQREELAQVEGSLEMAQKAKEQVSKLDTQVKDKTALLGELPLLKSVPCGGEGIFAACKFLVRAIAIQKKQPELEAELVQLKSAAEGQRTVASNEADLKKHRATVQQAITTQDAYVRNTRTAIQQTMAQRRAIVSGLARKRADVQVSEERERSRREQLDQVSQDLALVDESVGRVEAERADLVAIMKPGLVEELQTAGKAYSEAETALQQALTRAGTATERLARVREAVNALETLDGDLNAQQEEVSDWTLIQAGLGPTGIPALRVDLALPALSEFATTNLRECLGEGRWEVKFLSQKASADQKRVLETLEVVITRNGKTVDGVILCGGEGVLVNEAVSLALAFYRGTRESSKWEPGLLMRDETSSALGDLAGAYVEMLRNVVRRNGATQVLFASHHEGAIARADARLQIGGGAVVVR